MIEEQARVTRINANQVFIKSMQSSACKSCIQQSSCGTALYAKALPKREISLFSKLELDVGDTVLVGIEEHHLLLSSLFIYLLPLLMMLLSVGVYQGDDQSTALVALFSLMTGLYLVKQLQKHFINRYISPPHVIKKL